MTLSYIVIIWNCTDSTGKTHFSLGVFVNDGLDPKLTKSNLTSFIFQSGFIYFKDSKMTMQTLLAWNFTPKLCGLFFARLPFVYNKFRESGSQSQLFAEKK